MECEYKLKENIGFILESEKMNDLELSNNTGISRTTLNEIKSNGKSTYTVCEKFYSFKYETHPKV
jgi:copper oxidase (laccase) domain-containing protein